MAAYAFGQSVLLTQEFDVDLNDGNGPVPADPPLAGLYPGVSFRYLDPLGNPTTLVYGVDAALVRTGIGLYQVQLNPTMAGQYRYRWFTTAGSFAGRESSFDVEDSALATSSPPAGLLLPAHLPAAHYPYPTGYAQVSDIQDRISAGAWNAGGQSAAVNVAQADSFLITCTAAVDAVLTRSGYTVPLIPAPGFAAIGWQAWQLLKNATATLAAAMVENTRHSSNDASQDEKPNDLYALADDLLVRLETGADNLTAFGVAGGFAPEIDISTALFVGGMTDAGSGADSSTPMFTRDMEF